MAAVDFITALGRLLNDGAQRDAFAEDATAFVQDIGLRESDRAAFVRLAVPDLEFQAQVLLRKRFERVAAALPRTCELLGDVAWPQFLRQARSRSSGETTSAGSKGDALAFAVELARRRHPALQRQEFNRARFACGAQWFAVHVTDGVPVSHDLPAAKMGVQILLRSPRGRCHEWFAYLRW